jgi:hypothetical protein
MDIVYCNTWSTVSHGTALMTFWIPVDDEEEQEKELAAPAVPPSLPLLSTISAADPLSPSLPNRILL